jgi:Tfp pilus assembly protein PilX
MMHRNRDIGGFALLMTLIVLGVVASVGISMVELTIKQVRLATNSTDSETAFHAANAGLECARYWRRRSSADITQGNDFSPNCLEGTVDNFSNTDIGVSDGIANQYEFDVTWGSDPRRCSMINMITLVADAGGGGVTVSDMLTRMPGFPDGTTKSCDAGGRCTVISVQGFNRACGDIDNFGTVQREVLVQF